MWQVRTLQDQDIQTLLLHYVGIARIDGHVDDHIDDVVDVKGGSRRWCTVTSGINQGATGGTCSDDENDDDVMVVVVVVVVLWW